MSKKGKIKLFFIYLVLSFLIGGIFYRVVYSADAYTIKSLGLEFYNKYAFGNMRPIQYLITKGFMCLFGANIKYETIYTMYLTISIILLTTSMYLVYTYIIKLINENDKIKELSKLKKVLLFVCVLIIFFNRYLSDNLVYLENLTMILALFLAVIASIIYTKNIRFKNIIVLILLTISEFSYQTMITAFVVLSLLFYALKNNRKIDIKYIIKLTIHFIIPLLLLFCFSKIQFEGIEVNTRYGKGNEYLGLIVGIIAQVLIYCLEYIIYYSLFYIVFNSGNFKKEDKYVIHNLFLIIIISVCYSYSFGIINSGTISNRMAWSIGALAGIIYLYVIIFGNNLKIKKEIYISGMLLVCIIEFTIYFMLYGIYVRYNNTIKNNAEFVINYIDEYNSNHEEKIEKIALYSDDNITESDWYSVVVYLVPGIYNVEDNFYLHLKIYSNDKIGHEEASDKIKEKYFKGKDFTKFCDEEFIVENNVLHFCKY